MVQLRVSRGRNYILTTVFGLVILSSIIFAATFVQNASALSGTGSSGSPFIITDCSELQEMASDLGAYYELSGDIDCTATENWNSGKGFAPIGDGSGGPFTGHFDGNGHTITNLSIVRADDDPATVDNANNQEFVGLFGYTSGASVQNVTLEHAKVKGYRLVGGLIGRMQNGTLTNSSVNVTTADNDCTATPDQGGQCVWSPDGQYVGGLVGFLTGNATISYSHSGGVVKGSSSAVGGLVGYQTGTSSITTSTSAASVTGSQYVGGAVGVVAVDSATLTDVYATGNVSAQLAGGVDSFPGMYAGGLVGYIADAAQVSTSHAKGSVHADVSHAGGFVGYSIGATISNSYASGNVDVGLNGSYGSTVGGFAGQIENGTYYQNYSSGTVTARLGEVGGFVGLATLDQNSSLGYSLSLSAINAPPSEKGSFFGQATIDPSASVTFNYFDRSISGTDVCGHNGGTPITMTNACFAENASGTDTAYFYDSEHQPYVDYAHAARTWSTSDWYFNGTAIPIHMRELTSPKLDSPTSYQVVKDVPVRIAIPFPTLPGSNKLIFSNSERTIVLTLSDFSPETYPFEINIDDLLASDQVVSISPAVNSIPDGLYTVTFASRLNYGQGFQSPQSHTVIGVQVTRTPFILCEQPSSSNTTIHARCIAVPQNGFGTTTWQMRYYIAGTTDYHYVTLSDIHDANATIMGLTPGTDYRVQVQFTNNWGTSEWGTLAVPTTGTTPVQSSLINRTAPIGSTDVAITPTLPSNDTTVTITGSENKFQIDKPQQVQSKTNAEVAKNSFDLLPWVGVGVAALAAIVYMLARYQKAKSA